MTTRLANLNPTIHQSSGGPIRLSFDCPVCGPPYRVDIPIILNGLKAGPDIPMWAYSSPEPPDFTWDAVTISPSINNTTGGHGRKKPCSWHGNIANGVVSNA